VFVVSSDRVSRRALTLQNNLLIFINFGDVKNISKYRYIDILCYRYIFSPDISQFYSNIFLRFYNRVFLYTTFRSGWRILAPADFEFL